MAESDNVSDTVELRKRSVLEMDADEARRFFLKHESYASFDLPPYFDFSPLLEKISQNLPDEANSIRVSKGKPREYSDLNHTVLTNKDGKLAWRSLQLIHPVIYVQFVHLLTSSENWSKVTARIQRMSKNKQIECLSIPVESLSGQNDKAEQILHWWQVVEQKSIELSLEFEYLAYSDVTDCYGQIYTHSLAWALNGQRLAKDKRKQTSLIGNAVDGLLQDANYGQTNGIPQGSVLMDFVAEILLCYADLLISIEIKKAGITDYKILRYRDDYRVFTNNPVDAEKILQVISNVLHTLGLKLNAGKTGLSNEVISDSIKSEKLDWLTQRQTDQNLQKCLLIIHKFARKHQNKGILLGMMNKYLKRLSNIKEAPSNVIELIAIVVDIGAHNPRTYPICAAILSTLMQWVSVEDKWEVFLKVKRRFEKVPNNGHMQIWLQRFSIYFDKVENIFSIDDEPKCVEKLCLLVRGDDVKLWNNGWIRSATIKKILEKYSVLNEEKQDDLSDVIPFGEVSIFDPY